MSNKMCTLLFILLTASVTSQNLILNCNSTHTCAQTTFQCPQNSICTVICSYGNTCHGINLDFQIGSSGDIICSEDDACYGAIINFASDTVGNISCTSSNACYGIDIRFQKRSTAVIKCTTDNACHGANILFETRSNGQIKCTNNNACYGVTASWNGILGIGDVQCGYHSCFNANFDFGYSNATLLCSADYACFDASATCNSACMIECVADSCQELSVSGSGIINYSSTKNPTMKPTNGSTLIPTLNPTIVPTIAPTINPTLNPLTISPSEYPSFSPSKFPTIYPSVYQSNYPTETPTNKPTLISVIYVPTIAPTIQYNTVSIVTDVHDQSYNDTSKGDIGKNISWIVIFVLLAIVLLSVCVIIVLKRRNKKLKSRNEGVYIKMTQKYVPPKPTLETPIDETFVTHTKGNEIISDGNDNISEGIDNINNKQNDFDIVQAINETTAGNSDDSSNDELYGSPTKR
eukprot:553770_1